MVGGPALIGCRARAKLVPRVLRMRQVPGATTQAVASPCAAVDSTRRNLRISCAAAWHSQRVGSVIGERYAIDVLSCMSRDERVKDEL